MDGYLLGHQTRTSKVMYINSKDVSNFYGGVTTDYSYEFKEPVECRNGEGVLVSLVSAAIPYSFYNVRDGINNKLPYTIIGYQGSTGVVTIPPGNYTAASLKNVLVNYFATHTAFLEVAIDFDVVTHRYTFRVAHGSAVLILHFDNGSSSTSPNVEFGCSSSIYISDGTPQTSTSSVDLNGSIHTIFVRSDLPTNSVFESQSGGVSDVLASVMINANPGSVISHSASGSQHESLIQTKHIKHLRVRLTDERNRVLDLNGLHFHIGIMFKFVSLRQVETPLPQLPPQPKQPKQPPRTTAEKKQKQKRAYRKGQQKVSEAVRKANAAKTKKDTGKSSEK